MLLNKLKSYFLFPIFLFFFSDSVGVSFINNYKPENIFVTKIFTTNQNDDESYLLDELLSNVEDFINLPDGGTPWEIFGETGMQEYSFEDDQGYEWMGVRPEFSNKIKELNSKKILVQGYMFPLDQEEKQKTFLLIPFPASCPYYPHVSSNLIIEVHAKQPINYSFDAVNIEGILELVPNDDLYNVFFRLKNAKLSLN
tara:strand:- start:188 stop:781 length:594 start_codon:yes stop_codon:yes gene_type:complete